MKNLFIKAIFILFLIKFSAAAYGVDNVKLIVAGDECKFKCQPIVKDGVIYISADEHIMTSISSKLGASVSWLPGENKIVISKDKNKSYFIINNNIGLILNKPVKLTNSAFLFNGHPYVPLNHLSSTMMAYYSYDEKNNIAYLSPRLVNIGYKNTDNGGEIAIEATGPIKYTSRFLSNPPRIAIDIPNAILSLKEDLSIKNEAVESVKASQYSRNPDVIRVVVKLKIPISVKFGSRIRMDQVKLKLNYSNEDLAGNDNNNDNNPPQVNTSNQQNLITAATSQQITNVRVEQKDEIRKIIITTTGPVGFEWHRLKSPDNRFFIDFTDIVVPEKKYTVSVKDDILSDVRVSQYQRFPNIVRIVFKLEKIVGMKIYQSAAVKNQLIIEIGNNTVDEAYMSTTGTGYLGTATNKPSGKTIVIDPGHGGGDYGAINPQTGLAEKDITLDISLRLQSLLTKNGWNVILTHKTDRDVTSADSSDSEELMARANVANQANASLFISIHCDASSKSSVRGSTTYYHKDIDKNFAASIQKSLISKTGTYNRGIKFANFCVLKNTKMAAVLVETAFISNPDDASLLASPEFRQKVAEGLCDGINQYSGKPIVVGEQ